MIKSPLADVYGKQCADVKKLQNEADITKAALLALGESEIHGDEHKVVVTDIAPRVSVDWEALLATLVPSEKKRAALKKRFAQVGNPSTRVNVYGLPRL